MSEETKEQKPTGTRHERQPQQPAPQQPAPQQAERPERSAADEAARQRAFQAATNAAIQTVMSALEPLHPEQQRRVLSAVATVYGIGSQRPNQQRQQQQQRGGNSNGGR